MALPAAAAQADASWTGASASPAWGDATNWMGMAPAANTAVGILTFPNLGTCVTCYTTNNGLAGVRATSLAFTSTAGQYRILGSSPLTISGGITDTAGNTGVMGAPNGPVINDPLVLSAGQTWMIGTGFGTAYNNLSLNGAVTGAPSALMVPFAGASMGSGSSGDLYVTSDMELGPVTVTGQGNLHIGGMAGGGSVNGANGNAVALNNGARLIVNPSSKVGDLTIGTNSKLLLGTGPNNVGAVTLAAKGGVALGSSLSTQTYISNNGSTPGTDFSQVSATGNVTLGGQLILAQGRAGLGCATLSRGDVATLFTTTGTLSGTFANAPNGSLYTMQTVTGSCPSPPQVQINYDYVNKTVTATVVSGTTPTTTALAAPSPSTATTNQPVTLTATVTTTSSGTVAPAGTVSFASSGTAIPGCTAQPVTPTGGSNGTATCTTSFPAASSPESLAAAFTGTTASGQGSSISSPQALTVTKASSTTTLTASNKSPAVGGSVTYTATVTPGVGGPAKPSGTVQFRDGGTAIAGCDGRPLTAGASSSTATCTVTYPSAGSHSIIAGYGGDGSFGSSSSSPAALVNVQSGTPQQVSATTSPATHVRTSRATLNGSIATGGRSVSWKFEYGRRTAYGRTTPVQTIAGGQGTVAVSSVLKRLSPNARYHYRLVVNAAGQTVNGRDVTFTTRATGSLLFSARRLSVFGRTILMSEKCQSKVLCIGRFSLTTKVPVGKKKLATVVCASRGFRIKAHRTATTRARLSGACLRLLKPHGRLTVTYTSKTRTGQKGLSRRITLVLK